MEERITNIQVSEFLQDFRDNSTVEILEEGSKETNEIFQIAKARGIDLKKNKDLAGLKCVYAFTDIPNKNGAILPEKPFLKALPTMIGKPINIGHRRKFVVGHILDYRYQLKNKKAIMYGVVYKSNFIDEWEQVKKDFKAKKLNVSFEIWCPEDKKRMITDSTFELLQQEIAGCAILFRDEEPAFDGARVLALAKKLEEEQPSLVYASKYKENEIIVCEKDKCKAIPCNLSTDTTTVKVVEKKEQPTNITTKITCSNCKEQFEYNGLGDVSCPKCFAILDRSGNMIYPPQVKDFKVLCPSCKVNRWRILAKNDKEAKIKCLHCSKEYKVTYEKRKVNELLDKLDFVFTGSVNCYQCGKSLYFDGISSIKVRTLKCNKCGLTFSYDISKESYKRISKIEEIEKEQTSEKGGSKMAKEKKIEEKVEVIVKKKTESKVKEQPKAEGTPKAEEKPKAKETPKAEVAPKTEEKVEKAEIKKDTPAKESKTKQPKVEEKAKVEKPKVEKTEEKKTKKVEEVKKADKVETPKEEKKTEVKKEKVEETKKETPKEEKTETPVEEAKEETKEQKYAKGIRKLALQIKELKKQLISAKADSEKRVAFYKANAGEINKRREDIGDYGKDLTDEDILDDEKFAKAKADKENAKIEKGSAETVGTKGKDNDYYTRMRKEIDGQAFPKN